MDLSLKAGFYKEQSSQEVYYYNPYIEGDIITPRFWKYIPEYDGWDIRRDFKIDAVLVPITRLELLLLTGKQHPPISPVRWVVDRWHHGHNIWE